MSNITCEQISNYLDVDFTGKDVNCTSISTDSRSLQPGALFIALKGAKFDGHAYLDQAIERGAAALLVSEPLPEHIQAQDIPVITVADTLWAYGQIAALYRARFKIPMVAVTGSCGKTTTQSMIANILRQVGKTLSPNNSYNNEIGLPKTLLELNSEHKYAVLEMGAKKPGDIKYLMELVNPQVSVLTNVAPVHLQSFMDVDVVAATKGEIYQYLQPHGTAILNADDAYAPFWLSLLKTQNVISFGLEHTADITCAYIVEEHHRIKFELVTDLGTIQVILPLLGLHNVMNALAAAAAARALDISLEHIKAGLESYQPVQHRMQIKTGKQGAKIIDDCYNANPVAMRKAIDVLVKQLGTKIMVIGDMLELGTGAEREHKALGHDAKVAGIDMLLAFGDLSKLAVSEFGDNAMFYTEKDRLISDLTAMLNSNTVVLVKGSRGMRLEEVVDAIMA